MYVQAYIAPFFQSARSVHFSTMCTKEFHRNVAFTNIFFRKCHLTCHNSMLHGQYQAVSAFLPVVEECQRHATVRKSDVTILREAAGLLRAKGLSAVECIAALQPTPHTFALPL